MMNLFRSLMASAIALVITAIVSCTGNHKYETVSGDVLETKVCTLENGLKVYMTVNHEQPRIQTFIAVHAGSKHEPTDATGLAHYLEHMMFKGSTNFGTTSYEAEKPLLDKITDLYETYRKTSDPTERKAIYHQIDSISYDASEYFIPNEYDKLMAHIGADGSNAYTNYDVTCYTEDIPSNQIENWAKIQSERFKNMVLRGFHTELEAVYEEYNIGLNSDWDKLCDSIFTALTPTHPYRHGVIGLGEHLKSPSIVRIEEFFHQYYVPNNIAICLSGDFDPDEMMDVIQKYFGDMPRNNNLTMPKYDPQPELTKPVEKTVLTPNPEMMVMAWRLPEYNSLASDTLKLLSKVLCNGTAGLIDIDLNQQQRVVGATAEPMQLCDYGSLLVVGMPLPGQSLDEVKSLIQVEMKKLRDGKFSDDLVKGAITEMKLEQQNMLESNEARASQYVDAFINDVPWEQAAGQLSRIEKLTKKDVQTFAKRHFTDRNYVAIYKRQGQDPDIKPVEKPAITPIRMNRDSVSAFANEILLSKVKPIEPVFIDYDKDITKAEASNGLPVLYRQNTLNQLFTLTFELPYGTAADRYLDLTSQYVNLIGNGKMSAEEIAQQFYLLGCNMSIRSSMRETDVTLSGLAENMKPALELMESLLTNAKTDTVAFHTMVQNELQNRLNVLASFDTYRGALSTFLGFGQKGVDITLKNEELLSAKAEDITSRLHSLLTYKHRILYYGPDDVKKVTELLDDVHGAKTYKEPLQAKIPAQLVTKENECFVLPYPGTQSFVMCQYAGTDNSYSLENEPARQMYNEYFGGGMNTVVFQEMREKRSLCYHARAYYFAPSWKDQKEVFQTTVQSQNDKLADCITVFDDIINNMPANKKSFEISRNGLLTQLRTQRTTGMDIIDSYIMAERMGETKDPRSIVFEKLQNLTLKDIVAFQQSHVKGLHYRYGIAGDPNKLDKAALGKLGKVTILDPKRTFGF